MFTNWKDSFFIARETRAWFLLLLHNFWHEFSCSSKYYNRSLLVALNAISMGFLDALITQGMDLFVALKLATNK